VHASPTLEKLSCILSFQTVALFDTASQSYSIPSTYTAWRRRPLQCGSVSRGVADTPAFLVLRQFLKIEQTLSHGYQLSSLLITKHTSILIDRQPTLPVLLIIIIITLFIDLNCISVLCFTSSTLPIATLRQSSSRLSDQRTLIWLSPFHPLLSSSTSFPSHLLSHCLFPDYIVAHRFLRRPHDVSEQAQRLRSEDDADIFLGAMRAEFLNRFILLPMPCWTQLGRTRIHSLLSYHLSLGDLFNLPMPDDFSLMNPTFRLSVVWHG